MQCNLWHSTSKTALPFAELFLISGTMLNFNSIFMHIVYILKYYVSGA